MVAAVPALRCRQINECDADAVAALLARGFPIHDRQFWLRALAQLARHQAASGMPKYGYLLEDDGRIVGALLLICTTLRKGEATVTRCNLSSWYVEPAFRTYAPLLVSYAVRHKNVTYLNVSPAPHTLPIIEAQGFSRYCDGVFVAMPVFNGWFGGEKVRVVRVPERPDVATDPADEAILEQHAALGCVSLWCVADECAHPFVFRPRLAKRVVPCAQLIYCRDIADLARFAGPIGRLLARCGRPFVILDANGAVPGLLGWFNRGNMPKYFKGPLRPRLGDLAYTEQAVLGV